MLLALFLADDWRLDSSETETRFAPYSRCIRDLWRLSIRSGNNLVFTFRCSTHQPEGLCYLISRDRRNLGAICTYMPPLDPIAGDQLGFGFGKA